MQEFLLIAAAHFLALISPGQDFFLLIRTSLRQGVAAGVRTSFGIATANAVWIGLILWGVEQIRDWTPVMHGLKVFGAIFLIWLGWNFVKAKPLALSFETKATGPNPSCFWIGLMSGLSNPKNGLFYTGLFSVGISNETPFAVRSLYGLWMTGAVLFWDLAICGWFTRPALLGWLRRRQWQIERLAGGVLMMMGLALAFG